MSYNMSNGSSYRFLPIDPNVKCFRVNQTSYKIKSDFFTFIVCANTAPIIFHPRQRNFTGRNVANVHI